MKGLDSIALAATLTCAACSSSGDSGSIESASSKTPDRAAPGDSGPASSASGAQGGVATQKARDPGEPNLDKVPPELHSAARTLFRANAFGGWAMGSVGAPSNEVLALRTLVSHPEGAAVLRQMAAEATDAGRLMALAGLHRVDRPSYDAAVGPFRTLERELTYLPAGCDLSGDRVTASRIVHQPDAIVLSAPGESLRDWVAKNPGKRLVFDLDGGAFSALLLDPKEPSPGR